MAGNSHVGLDAGASAIVHIDGVAIFDLEELSVFLIPGSKIKQQSDPFENPVRYGMAGTKG